MIQYFEQSRTRKSCGHWPAQDLVEKVGEMQVGGGKKSAQGTIPPGGGAYYSLKRDLCVLS